MKLPGSTNREIWKVTFVRNRPINSWQTVSEVLIEKNPQKVHQIKIFSNQFDSMHRRMRRGVKGGNCPHGFGQILEGIRENSEKIRTKQKKKNIHPKT